ncbi:hypothetical protein Pgin02_02075 [Porphyromonas gingivalis]
MSCQPVQLSGRQTEPTLTIAIGIDSSPFRWCLSMSRRLERFREVCALAIGLDLNLIKVDVEHIRALEVTESNIFRTCGKVYRLLAPSTLYTTTNSFRRANTFCRNRLFQQSIREVGCIVTGRRCIHRIVLGCIISILCAYPESQLTSVRQIQCRCYQIVVRGKNSYTTKTE